MAPLLASRERSTATGQAAVRDNAAGDTIFWNGDISPRSAPGSGDVASSGSSGSSAKDDAPGSTAAGNANSSGRRDGGTNAPSASLRWRRLGNVVSFSTRLAMASRSAAASLDELGLVDDTLTGVANTVAAATAAAAFAAGGGGDAAAAAGADAAAADDADLDGGGALAEQKSFPSEDGTGRKAGGVARGAAEKGLHTVAEWGDEGEGGGKSGGTVAGEIWEKLEEEGEGENGWMVSDDGMSEEDGSVVSGLRASEEVARGREYGEGVQGRGRGWGVVRARVRENLGQSTRGNGGGGGGGGGKGAAAAAAAGGFSGDGKGVRVGVSEAGESGKAEGEEQEGEEAEEAGEFDDGHPPSTPPTTAPPPPRSPPPPAPPAMSAAALFKPRGRKSVESIRVTHDARLYCVLTDVYVTCLKMPPLAFFVAVFAAPIALSLLFTPLFLLGVGGLQFEDGILPPLHPLTHSHTHPHPHPDSHPYPHSHACSHSGDSLASQLEAIRDSAQQQAQHEEQLYQLDLETHSLPYHQQQPQQHYHDQQQQEQQQQQQQQPHCHEHHSPSTTCPPSSSSCSSSPLHTPLLSSLPPRLYSVLVTLLSLTTSTCVLCLATVQRALFIILNVFLYSVSLSTTFGGSPVSAHSPYTLVLANLNTLLAQFLFVFLSGAVFARMSVPSQPVRCSRTALISDQAFALPSSAAASAKASESAAAAAHPDRVRVFSARFVLTGPAPCDLVDAQVSLTFRCFHMLPSGSVFCSVHDLPVVKGQVPYLQYGMSVRHIVDESSPLWGHTPASLQAGDASFALVVSGTDRASMQPVFHIQDYYVHDGEVQWGSEYDDFVSVSHTGERVLDHSRVDAIKTFKSAAFVSLSPSPPLFSPSACTLTIEKAADQGRILGIHFEGSSGHGYYRTQAGRKVFQARNIVFSLSRVMDSGYDSDVGSDDNGGTEIENAFGSGLPEVTQPGRTAAAADAAAAAAEAGNRGGSLEYTKRGATSAENESGGGETTVMALKEALRREGDAIIESRMRPVVSMLDQAHRSYRALHARYEKQRAEHERLRGYARVQDVRVLALGEDLDALEARMKRDGPVAALEWLRSRESGESSGNTMKPALAERKEQELRTVATKGAAAVSTASEAATPAPAQAPAPTPALAPAAAPAPAQAVPEPPRRVGKALGGGTVGAQVGEIAAEWERVWLTAVEAVKAGKAGEVGDAGKAGNAAAAGKAEDVEEVGKLTGGKQRLDLRSDSPATFLSQPQSQDLLNEPTGTSTPPPPSTLNHTTGSTTTSSSPAPPTAAVSEPGRFPAPATSLPTDAAAAPAAPAALVPPGGEDEAGGAVQSRGVGVLAPQGEQSGGAVRGSPLGKREGGWQGDREERGETEGTGKSFEASDKWIGEREAADIASCSTDTQLRPAERESSSTTVTATTVAAPAAETEAEARGTGGFIVEGSNGNSGNTVAATRAKWEALSAKAAEGGKEGGAEKRIDDVARSRPSRRSGRHSRRPSVVEIEEIIEPSPASPEVFSPASPAAAAAATASGKAGSWLGGSGRGAGLLLSSPLSTAGSSASMDMGEGSPLGTSASGPSVASSPGLWTQPLGTPLHQLSPSPLSSATGRAFASDPGYSAFLSAEHSPGVAAAAGWGSMQWDLSPQKQPGQHEELVQSELYEPPPSGAGMDRRRATSGDFVMETTPAKGGWEGGSGSQSPRRATTAEEAGLWGRKGVGERSGSTGAEEGWVGSTGESGSGGEMAERNSQQGFFGRVVGALREEAARNVDRISEKGILAIPGATGGFYYGLVRRSLGGS
ncbi:unnamed protein product [Closterium sp. Naga37s-1]|nr:unnamed protein product [Closterium sp. Naga37s-1]